MWSDRPINAPDFLTIGFEIVVIEAVNALASFSVLKYVPAKSSPT